MMPWRTLAELLYVAVSVAATYGVTWAAVWGYPQGGEVIWPVGIGSMMIVVAMGIQPLMRAWDRDRAKLETRTHD